MRVEPARGTAVAIAERCKPDPRRRPGYLRVYTVHQGQQDGKPGPNHIHIPGILVDAVVVAPPRYHRQTFAEDFNPQYVEPGSIEGIKLQASDKKATCQSS